MRLAEFTEQIASNDAIGGVARPLAATVKKAIPGGPVKDTLSGVGLGHPLHPVLTDVAIGAYGAAGFLDLFAGRRAQPAVKALLGLGLAVTVPTAASGAADWSETSGRDTRVGAVHGAINATAAVLFAASLLSRRGGRRAAGRLLNLSGLTLLAGSGYLGGHLSFSRGVGVNHTFMEEGPEEWTPVFESSALVEGQPERIDAAGNPVVLYRLDDRVYAIGARCTHAGGPIDEGDFDDAARCVRCPWHGSAFSLDNGEVLHGPASAPQPSYGTRLVGGKVEIRRI